MERKKVVANRSIIKEKNKDVKNIIKQLVKDVEIISTNDGDNDNYDIKPVVTDSISDDKFLLEEQNKLFDEYQKTNDYDKYDKAMTMLTINRNKNSNNDPDINLLLSGFEKLEITETEIQNVVEKKEEEEIKIPDTIIDDMRIDVQEKPKTEYLMTKEGLTEIPLGSNKPSEAKILSEIEYIPEDRLTNIAEILRILFQKHGVVIIKDHSLLDYYTNVSGRKFSDIPVVRLKENTCVSVLYNENGVNKKDLKTKGFSDEKIEIISNAVNSGIEDKNFSDQQ